MIAARFFPLPPSEAPQNTGVIMPPQDLWDRAERDAEASLGTSPPSTWLARSVIAALTLAMTGFFAYSLYEAMLPDGIGMLEGVFIFLATSCFVWVSIGTSAALLGFSLLRRSAAPMIPYVPPGNTPLSTRTALLFPIYHESPTSIAANIEELSKELSKRGYRKNFSIFILSDTRPGPERDFEAKTFEVLKWIVTNGVEMFYRHRSENVAKKAGNIQDWIVRHGGEYDHFVIFDADSIMSPETLIRLAAAMESNPYAGLIQTVPRLISSRTIFARLQQFAHAAYGPPLARGLSAWSGQSANYWGHNAIIRTRPFAKYAGLPKLQGAPPFGGHIQSHDFVEAALLRRAGWAVYMAPQLEGSYESSPPTLIDSAVRDRRWVQGNLQHLGLITVRGLTLTSRVHLFMGAYGYLVASFWVALMLVGVLLALSHDAGANVTASGIDELMMGDARPVLVATVVALFLPKLLGLVNWLLTTRRTASLAPRTIAGSLIEVALSILMAPIRLMTHLQAILEVIRGRDSGWAAQRREADGLTLAEALRFHYVHVLIGIGLAAVSLSVSWWLVLWASPVAVGLILSPWITWLSSNNSPQSLSAMLATDEDLTQPEIVRKVESRELKWRRFCGGPTMFDASSTSSTAELPPPPLVSSSDSTRLCTS